MSKSLIPVVLTDPRQLHLIQLVTDAVPSPASKRQYRMYLERFFDWLRDTKEPGLTKPTVNRFRQYLQDRGLSASTINGHLSAIRKLAVEAADSGLFSPQDAQAVSRASGMPKSGRRTGLWLTLQQAQILIQAPDAGTIPGKRDRAILGLLVGCGLRREELANLTWEHFQQREGRWVLVDIVGKGNKTRTVPVPTWAAALVVEWQRTPFAVMHAEEPGAAHGRMFWSLYKGNSGRWRSGQITGLSINRMAKRHALAAGLPPVAAHDLRRTFAKLAYKGGGKLDQIQITLGHASLTTTENYLGVQQNLQEAPCDHLGITIQNGDDT